MFVNRATYHNFTPTDGFQLYTDALLGKLLDLAPSDATSYSSIAKNDGMYSCKIVINSAVHRFEAFIEAVNPKSAFEEARRRIIRQLAKWRKLRFRTK